MSTARRFLKKRSRSRSGGDLANFHLSKHDKNQFLSRDEHTNSEILPIYARRASTYIVPHLLKKPEPKGLILVDFQNNHRFD